MTIRDALAAEALADADCVKAQVTREEADRRKSLLKQNLSSIEESERASADAEFQEASCRTSKIVAAASKAKVLVAKSQVDLQETMRERAMSTRLSLEKFSALSLGLARPSRLAHYCLKLPRLPTVNARPTPLRPLTYYFNRQWQDLDLLSVDHFDEVAEAGYHHAKQVIETAREST